MDNFRNYCDKQIEILTWIFYLLFKGILLFGGMIVGGVTIMDFVWALYGENFNLTIPIYIIILSMIGFYIGGRMDDVVLKKLKEDE